jgi:hypothetical protein
MDLVRTMRVLEPKKKINDLTGDYLQVGAITRIVWSARKRSKRDSLKMENLLHLSCHSMATKPHDKIFGIVGMCKDSKTLLGHPSYTDPLEDIVEEMTRNMLLKTNGRSWKKVDVGILVLRPSKAIKHKDLRKQWPSWVIDWPTFWEHRYGYIWTSRANCGLGSKHRASGHSSSDVSFSEDGKVLLISGVLFDTIESLSGPSEFPMQIKEENRRHRELHSLDPDMASVELPKWDIDQNVYGDEAAMYNAIWRCLVMDRSNIVDERAPSSFAGCFGRIWQKQSAPRGVGDFKIHGRSLNYWARKYSTPSNSGDVQESSEELDEQVSVIVFEMTLGSYFSRRLIQTKKGFIGLAHAQSRVGDCICLLSGCTIPVILRRCEGGFTIVGAGYVQGIMDGEAWEERQRYGISQFQIR